MVPKLGQLGRPGDPTRRWSLFPVQQGPWGSRANRFAKDFQRNKEKRCLTVLGICKALPGPQEVSFSHLCHGSRANRHRARQASGTEREWLRTFPGWLLFGCLKNLRTQQFLSRALPSSKEAPAGQASSQPCTQAFAGSSGSSWCLCFQPRSGMSAGAEPLPPVSCRVRGRNAFHALWSRGLRATPKQVPVVQEASSLCERPVLS